MTKPKVQMVTATLSEHRGLAAIFSREVHTGSLSIISYMQAQTAVGGAELSLLNDPERPVALVLDAETVDAEAIDQRRRSMERRLGRLTPEPWTITLAVPNIESWALADPEIRALFESDEAFGSNRLRSATRLADFVRQHAIDRAEVGRQHPEFARLLEYLGRFIPAAQPVS